MRPLTRRQFTWLAGMAMSLGIRPLSPVEAQNLVEGEASGPVLPPIPLTTKQLLACVDRAPALPAAPHGGSGQRVVHKLSTHVSDLLEGFPWAPFQVTHGISGYEAYFGHPDHLYLALSGVLPVLNPGLSQRVRRLLRSQLATLPPYAPNGWDNGSGRPREAYDIPQALRLRGHAPAMSLLGVYAFWSYCRVSSDLRAAREHWSAIRVRCAAVLDQPYAFDGNRRSQVNGEAQRLNGDLAGMIGLVRLARWNRDAGTERKALARARELLTLRVNLERVNPQFVEKSQSSSKHLHLYKPFRYLDLVPEVGGALRTLTDGVAAKRLREFREARNGWFLAFGDRLLGGENYTSPPDMSAAMFAGAAFVEATRAEDLLRWVDVPWCRADLFFLEKCAAALWSAAGRRWSG